MARAPPRQGRPPPGGTAGTGSAVGPLSSLECGNDSGGLLEGLCGDRVEGAVTTGVTVALALGVLLPLAQPTRRRLT
jgi:hypothetical protein